MNFVTSSTSPHFANEDQAKKETKFLDKAQTKI